MEIIVDNEVVEIANLRKRRQDELKKSPELFSQLLAIESVVKSLEGAIKPAENLMKVVEKSLVSFSKEVMQFESVYKSLSVANEPYASILRSVNQQFASFQQLEKITAVAQSLRELYAQQELLSRSFKNTIDPAIFKSLEKGLRLPASDFSNHFQNIDWLDSLSTLEKAARNISVEEAEESVAPEKYSEEQLQFIQESVESWLNGTFNLGEVFDRIKANKFVSSVFHTIVIMLLYHSLCFALSYEEQRLQKDYNIVEAFQHYAETSIPTYQVLKNYIEREQPSTSRPLGISRTEIKLREGPGKTTPIVPEATVAKHAIVFILETDPSCAERVMSYKPKKNWRRVSVNINGTFVEGWVPESVIQRIHFHPLKD